MWYDPGNIFYYSEGKLDPLDDVASVAGLITGMCVKDFRPPQEVSINPGSGQVRFAELMSRLQAGGFRGGPLVVETLAPGDLATVTANALAAREFLAGLVA
jgi:sugar phosphate isomerase/epimerase